MEKMTFIKKNLYITKYYKKLITYTKQNKNVGSVNEWIIDNYYLISEQQKIIKQELKSTKNIRKVRKDELYSLVYKILSENDFEITSSVFFNKINDYQLSKDIFFSYDEINFIHLLIRVLIIYELCDLCKKLNTRLDEKENINNLFSTINNNRYNKGFDIEDYITIDESILESPYYIEELSYKLNELGQLTEDTFMSLNELLIANNKSLKNIIKIEHDSMTKESVLMKNLFKLLSKTNHYKFEYFYNNISYTEKELTKEKIGIFDSMDDPTKSEYRDRIKKLVKKSKMQEYYFIKELVEEANRENTHIGFYLFKEPNYNLRSVIYITSIMFFTLLISFVMSFYMGVIAFLLLIIPVCSLVVEIINKIIFKFSKPHGLFSMKIEGNLKEEHSTMVVIPTIVNSEEKIEKMFNNLEIYYLANKSKNLYFTLLGDCKSAKEKTIPLDEKMVKAGMKKAKELNEKYKSNIFHFVYRNRFYNDSEECFLGYERKRGALMHFNGLLLNKYDEKEKSEYFRCHTFDDFNKTIKYVITLDADTQLLLNTALKLVGTMIHPMNTPVLSPDNKKVIKGYGLIQPKVGIDVNVTNKSIYSQLFAGLGGLDVYSSKTFDFYQDVFGEGSFVGKGIYDLDVFEKILDNAFPKNLILSHDLIEGNYVRAGYASDIELFDDFPSKYLNDAIRHQRWTRGDWQVISWLKKKVKNENNDVVSNPTSKIGKWKIFDNLRRSLRSLFLLSVIFYGFSIGKNDPSIYAIFVAAVIATPILFYLLNQLFVINKVNLRLKYYLNLIRGLYAVINKSLIVLALLPYEAYLYSSAIVKSLYRMNISKKNLLNWITAEEVEATSKNTLSNYIKNFKPNYIAAILLLVVTYIFRTQNLYLAISIALIWFFAPILMYNISRDFKEDKKSLDEDMIDDVKEIARRTWKFFDKFLTDEYNYLIPDNYQLNRLKKADYRTSPTNIGFSLVSIISACELKIISERETIDKITNVINSVEELTKWNGHLFNWYNIYNKKEIQPFFVSTVDSGNFVACLYVLKGFLEKRNKNNDLIERVKNLIDDTNFLKLYNTDLDVFSGGYNVDDGELLNYHYDKFASETRIGSFVAIAKGDVPYKHWFHLDKTLTKYKCYKGIASWSGTMFEYYMPLIFMKTYKHTLLDEAYLFSSYVQKQYIKQVNPSLPWGISESAYNELDDAQNYKYQAFGVPYLKFRDTNRTPIVISPYGSIMSISKNDMDVYNNIKKLKKIDMYDEYGFYEAYDNEDESVVKVYYAHHQGMILSSLTNYLNNNIIQEYFHTDKKVQAMEILLKEKVQIKPYIDLKISKYKKFDYKREDYKNDIREQVGVMPIPEMGVLSNGFYSILINDRGVGFSKYKNLQINRYRKISDENYGTFMFIKNKHNNKIWSNTYSPSNKEPDKYHAVFASDCIKYMREDDNIITNTEIIVVKDHTAEIRKITIENNNYHDVSLELTSYGEVIMSRNEEDVVHRTFNSITIDSEIDYNTSSLIFKRTSRTKRNTEYFVVHRMFYDNDNSRFEFETSREKFVGRNNVITNADVIVENKPLSCSEVSPIDPIMSVRKTIDIKSNDKKVIYLLTGFGKSKEQIMEIVDKYKDKKTVDNAFDTAKVMNNMRNSYSNFTGYQLRVYNLIIKYLYQTAPINEDRRKVLAANNLSQQDLWKFGVSGDIPIMLVSIDSVENLGFIKQALQAFEFCKSRTMYIDVVIINGENNNKSKIVKSYVDNLIYRIDNLNYFENSLGNVHIINKEDISDNEMVLLKTITRLYLNASSDKSFEEQILGFDDEIELDKDNKGIKLIENKKAELPENIEFYNGYGGFVNNGTEYIIDKNNTPMPWVNVLSNKTFGSIVSNNLGGYTYAYNSREYKITSWSNDPVSDPNSEAFIVNGRKFTPNLTKHGFGYTIFESETNEYKITIKVFVGLSDNIKFYNMDIENKLNEKQLFDIDFITKLVLGTSEELTNRHILSEFDKDNNSIIMKNVYNRNFRDLRVFITSTEEIKRMDLNDVVNKSVGVTFDIDSLKSKNITFMIGCNNEIDKLIKKFNCVKKIVDEFTSVTDYWTEKLSLIKVKTPDKSFDYIMNGWYLYQNYASRLYARSGFYQAGGAFGFRDQLQDCMSIIYSDQEHARSQILRNSSHQFTEGDVLHWWHEELMFGSRTKFSDDYLWLVYVTFEYLKITEDYSILDEKTPFVEGEPLREDESEKGINYWYSSEEITLYDHLKLCIEKATSKYGEHGLPLMGSGDWNDGMNKVGIKGKGESVWVGFFLYDILEKFVEIAEYKKEKEDFIKTCKKNASKLKRALNLRAWDGLWYLRAFFDNGEPLGSKRNKECQIDLISQSWSILTGIANKDKQELMLEEVENRLVDNENKIIKLLTPPFKKLETNPGYISYYIPGVRENGAQYTHAALWYILSLLKIGKVEKAYEYYSMINPINRTLDKESVEKYKTEPYVISADVYSNEQHAGRGGWTWYTGSSSWAYKIGLEEIIGFKLRGDKLTINPKINPDWTSFEITYKYKSTVYNITVDNKYHVSSGVKEVLLDNKKQQDNIIELKDDKKEHIVIISMGGK